MRCVGGCGIDAVSLSDRIGGIDAAASWLEDDNEDHEGRLKVWGRRRGVGGTPLCQSSGDGGDDRHSRVGSAPDNGTEVVGVSPVSSSMMKSTDSPPSPPKGW